MRIQTEHNERGEWILTPSGRIDNTTSETLREAIAAVPADMTQLVIDFRDVVYISSAGLRELLICRKRFQGNNLRIVNVSRSVMSVFEMTGFDQFLPVESTDDYVSTYVQMSLEGLLNRLAEEAADRTALKDPRGIYTWRDVDRASQIIAEDLSRLGVKAGTHVGICGANSVNWVLTFFAVQKLNAMAMLINPALSAAEIGRVCSIGDITVLCWGEMREMAGREDFLSEICSAEGCRVSRTYSFRRELDLRRRFDEYDALRGRFEQKTEPDMPCVVIFTSGSTGKPKGVILSSYNLLNAAACQVRAQKMSREDSELLVVPLFHILGMVVCLLPCAMMCTPLYIPDDIHTDTLIRTMRQERPTLAHAVPTMVIAIMNSPSFDKDALSSLRCTLLAGSRTDETVMRRLRAGLPRNHFIVAYGLSEMAPVSQTLYDDSEDHVLYTVGKRVDNIRIRIMNRDTGEECPPGVPGEILVQGFNLMTGYYKLPFSEQAIDSEGWLHTGDMGSLDEEGYLTLTGRYKELIIRGGENIMPGEVEAAIAELPGIQEVRVVGVPSTFYGEEAAACITLMPGTEWDEAKARTLLAEKLARYKIPAWFIVLEDLPKLASGKIDGVSLKAAAENFIRGRA